MTPYEEPVRMTAEPALFASAMEEPRRRGGLGLWFAAAVSLVLGIVIGFASGYRAGQNPSAVPAAVDGPAPTSGSASPGKPFSESSVSDPVRLEPEEIVPSPPENPPAQKPAPVAPSPPVGRTLSGPLGAPDPGVPAAPAPRGGVARPTNPSAVEEKPGLLTGPGSLQVVSRPAGAEVVLDGKPVGRTPLSIEVSPGAHTVRLALPGFNGWQTTVDVKPGSPARVAASLEQ